MPATNGVYGAVAALVACKGTPYLHCNRPEHHAVDRWESGPGKEGASFDMVSAAAACYRPRHIIYGDHDLGILCVLGREGSLVARRCDGANRVGQLAHEWSHG
jgi:hypothetical protein